MVPTESPRLARLVQRLASYTPSMADEATLIWAAVAVVLVPNPDALLLIRRAERTGDPWSGHMALPGGRRDPTDAQLLDTAMRETAEEVGLRLRAEQYVGTLDDVAPRTPVLPPIAVRPFVFVVPERPRLTPNVEVAAVHWVPLDRLLHPATYGAASIEVQGLQRSVEAFRVDDGIVWGMTERILSRLVVHIV